MKVDAALELFASVPKIRRVLQTLHDVGLGYLPLGQSAPTLSGGEAQRVKLAAELARPDTGRTLYILDEPTTGLHLDDTKKLLAVVHRLADLGNTVVIIEHNLEVIKTADWLIDLGPEAGAEGGKVVAAGPPEAVAKVKASLTGQILKGVLAAGPREERPTFDPKQAARKIIEAAKGKPAIPEADEAPSKAPWEVDGRAWHTVGQNGRSERPRGGTAGSSSGSSTASRPWATSPRPTGASGASSRSRRNPTGAGRSSAPTPATSGRCVWISASAATRSSSRRWSVRSASSRSTSCRRPS